MAFKYNVFTGKFDYYEAGSVVTPGGSNTQVQFNDSSAFGGDSGLTYAKSTDTLTVGTASAGLLNLPSATGDPTTAGITLQDCFIYRQASANQRIVMRGASSNALLSSLVAHNPNTGSASGVGFLFAGGLDTAFIGGIASQRIDAASNSRTVLRVLSNGSLTATDNTAAFFLEGSSSGVIAKFTVAPTAPGSGSSSERFGLSSIASNTSTVAIGNSASASGLSATVVGAGSSSSTANSVVVGQGITLTSNDSQVVIGAGASANGQYGIAIGRDSLARQSRCVAIGGQAIAGGPNSADNQTVAVGGLSFTNQGANDSVAVGYNAGVSLNSASSIAIGSGANVIANAAQSIVMGRSAANTAANQFVAGSSSFPISNIFFGKGVVNATPTAYTINGTGGTGSNIAGAAVVLAGGKSTGTGAGGNVALQTTPSSASSSTANTLVDRHIVVAQGKSLTSGAAASLFEIALPTLTMTGGVIHATILCTDGTDVQSLTNEVTFAAVNKAGTYTTQISDDPNNDAKATSAGTLSTNWSILNGTNKVTIQLTATTSLTPTSFKVYYSVDNHSEQAVTIL